jgi:hypothetical protein
MEKFIYVSKYKPKDGRVYIYIYANLIYSGGIRILLKLIYLE